MRKRINNQGFSLVELIVIMVIIVVLATTVVVSFVNTADQKVKAGATLISKYLDNTLNSSMTKGSAWIRIRYDADKDNYYVEDSDNHQEKLPANVTIRYDIENGQPGISVDKDNPELILSFDRVKGAFSPIIKTINDDGTFTYMTSGDSTTNVYTDNIHVVSGDKARVIHLYVKTGVYAIEEE